MKAVAVAVVAAVVVDNIVAAAAAAAAAAFARVVSTMAFCSTTIAVVEVADVADAATSVANVLGGRMQPPHMHMQQRFTIVLTMDLRSLNHTKTEMMPLSYIQL